MGHGHVERTAPLKPAGIKKNFLLFFSSTLVALCLLEFGLRVFSPPRNIAAGTLDTPKAALYGWAMPPHQELRFVDPDTGENLRYFTNSEGWKDIEHTFDKPEGIFRILVIGDSITVGLVRPDDSYINQIRELLIQNQITHVEVISMGVGAWGTDQILEVLKLEGLKYNPDLVIYQLNPNDLTDNLSPNDSTPQDHIRWNKPFKYEIRNGELVRIFITPPEQPDSKPNRFLMRSAIIYHLVQIFDKIQNKLEATRQTPETHTNWWDQFPIHPTTPLRYYSGEQTPEMSKAWELMAALVLEMKRTVESTGASFIVFTTAGDRGYRQWNIEHEWIFTDAEGDYILWEGERVPVNWNLQLEKIEEISVQHNIQLIKPVRTYERYKNDAHPNASGNLNMALDIVDYLLEEGLLAIGAEQ